MSLTREQKISLIDKFADDAVNGEGNSTTVNEILGLAGFSSRLPQSQSDKICDIIIANIPAKEFYELIYARYDVLNEKYDFDGNSRASTSLCFALQNVAYQYHLQQLQDSKNKAWYAALPFSPFANISSFARSIYSDAIQAQVRNQDIQEVFIDESDLAALKHTRGKHKLFGLMNKTMTSTNNTFKDDLFSKNHNIRKHMTSSERGLFGRYGINLLGTKEQIDKFDGKIESAKLERKLC